MWGFRGSGPVCLPHTSSTAHLHCSNPPAVEASDCFTFFYIPVGSSVGCSLSCHNLELVTNRMRDAKTETRIETRIYLGEGESVSSAGYPLPSPPDSNRERKVRGSQNTMIDTEMRKKSVGEGVDRQRWS